MIVFPKEIISQSHSSLHLKHSIKSQVIYISVLIFLTFCLALLPVIKIDVSVKSQGIIRSPAERNLITVPLSGRISQIYFKENEPVELGSLLFSIDTGIIDQQLQIKLQRQQIIRKYLEDLEGIKFSIDNPSHKRHIISSLYQLQKKEFEQEQAELKLDIENLKQIHSRNIKLYKKEIISISEFENSEYRLKAEKKKLELLINRWQTKWEREQVEYERELESLIAEEQILLEEREKYKVYAPINGVIQDMAGISDNSFVYVNQKIAEISPSTDLVAELFISTKDIGLLKDGMTARFQIDAFNYNEWGNVTGKIIEISNDVTVQQGQPPYFKVRCSLDKDYLRLKNGYKGNLKKGMTLQGRFIVARRSLFQLMYEDIDNWLNPT